MASYFAENRNWYIFTGKNGKLVHILADSDTKIVKEMENIISKDCKENFSIHSPRTSESISPRELLPSLPYLTLSLSLPVWVLKTHSKYLWYLKNWYTDANPASKKAGNFISCFFSCRISITDFKIVLPLLAWKF